MEQRFTMVTLAVDDVAATRRFFENGLGWRGTETPTGDIAFYQAGGSVLAVYDRRALERDLDRPVPPDATGAVTLAWNGRSRDEVDAAYAKAIAAGAEAVKTPEEVFWGGYSGYVIIPGGHLFEIAYNPFWPLAEDGTVILPK